MVAYVDSYYRDTRRVALADTAALAGDVRADVAVVGGGITGCSAALHLAERGYAVALVEANRIGWGASGRSGGQILAGFGTEMGTIARLAGPAAARAAWEMSREAVRLTAALVARHAIPCDLKWGAIHAATKPRHLRAFAALQQEMRELYGYQGLIALDRDALRARVCSDAYMGGLYEAEGGHLHPLNYTLGLARAAQQSGARLYEDCAVREIRHGKRVTLVTAGGRLTADFAVLAGNAYLGADIAPELRGRVMPVENYISATAPLSEAQVAATLPGDDAVADANFVLDYYRLSADRRLLYGGQVSYGKHAPWRLRARMAARLTRLFPVLSGVRMDYHWGGRVAVTMNRAPHIGRLRGNVFFSQGYSGHGLALAGLSGQLLAETISGQAERFDLYTHIRHRRFPGGEHLRTPLLVLATHFYRLRDLL